MSGPKPKQFRYTAERRVGFTEFAHRNTAKSVGTALMLAGQWLHEQHSELYQLDVVVRTDPDDEQLGAVRVYYWRH